MLPPSLAMLLQVKGNSMFPVLREGDWVELVASALTPGRILVARTPEGKLIIHRLVRISGPTLITRGDNTPGCDRPWTHEEILGEVGRVIRTNSQISPRQEITLGLRTRWVYLSLRHSLQSGLRKMVRLVGRRQSLSG